MLRLQLLILLVAGCCLAANHKDCGTKGPSSNSRVVGGENAKPLEFPWQGSLRKRSLFGWYHTCGCALLNEEWVLTAAHCVEQSPDPDNYQVKMGEHDTSKNEGNEVDVGASKVIIHPQWDRDAIDNDVAVIKLKTKLDLAGKYNYLGTVCLPDKEDLDKVVDYNPCIATGWGLTEYQGSQPNILQKVKVDVTRHETCVDIYNDVHKITPGMICFGEKDKGVCNGDSGGPLNCQRKEDGRWYNYGTHSFVVECNKQHYPSAGARNSQFAKWIWDTIENN